MMSIYTASQASQTVAGVSLAQQQAAQASLVAQYQVVFDAITTSAAAGQTQLAIRWTKRQYSQAAALFIANGYSITALPADGVALSDNAVLYPVTISWPAYVPGPAITALTPTVFSATVGVPFRCEFIPQGGTTPYTFSTSGLTPSGLVYSGLTNSSTLVLSGTPITAAIEYNVLTISIVDSLNQTFTQTVSWTVTNRLVAVAGTVPTGSQTALSYIIGLS